MDKKLARTYLKAMIDLYGVVPISKAIEIIDGCGDGPVARAFLESLDLQRTPVVLDGDRFIHECLDTDEEVDELLAAQADKPFYVPDRESLLKRANDDEYDRPQAFEDLKAFLMREMSLDDEMAEGICDDLQIGFSMEQAKVQDILYEFNRRKISFRGDKQVGEVVRMAVDLANHTRTWLNRGFTPRELFDRFERPNLQPLPDQPFDLGEWAKSSAEDEGDELDDIEDPLVVYVVALVNLYGAVPKSEVVRIYNQQMTEPITERDLDNLDLVETGVEAVDNLFVEESLLLDDDALSELLAKQGNKPFYVPEQAELLKYYDNMYRERPPSFHRLKDYVRKQFNLNEVQADELCEDIHLIFGFSEPSLDHVYFEFTRRKIRVTDAQRRQLTPLIMELANTTRMWAHRGETPEIINLRKGVRAAIARKPATGSAGAGSGADSGAGSGSSAAAGPKVGRNDPCPCGSGRKFKQCCGK